MKFVIIFFLFAASNIAFANNSKFVAENDVVLNLYTRKNPTTPRVLKFGDLEDLLLSNFQLEKPVKVFSHGWTNQSKYDSLVKAFLNVGDFNVILVDWTKGTVGEESVVVSNAPFVGKFVGSFLDWLNTLGMRYSQVHLAGHSLGCHVSGWIGRSSTLGRVEVLTALDPSKKFWEDSPDKVNAGDAKYVEVIHTNTAYHALILPTGTADFYPNGGATNPGCNNNNNCDHMRAMLFFEESLLSDQFIAQKCNNYAEMVSGNCANSSSAVMGGTGAAKTISGVYFLQTNAVSPYAQG